MGTLKTLVTQALDQYELTGELTERPVTHVTADSREVGGGGVFVAIPGLRVDGHRFITQAVAQGAVAVVGTQPVETRSIEARSVEAVKSSLPYLRVQDSREALASLCAALHGFPSRDLTVFGVTGTDGKTTTCTLLESILAAYLRQTHLRQSEGDAKSASVGVITTNGARIAGDEQDTGFHVTTPDAPQIQAYLGQMRDAGCPYAVVETTSHGLDQRRVASVDYDVAAVTNITHEHLDYHGTVAAYRAAKARLFQALFASPPKPDVPRVAVLNRDDSSHDYLLDVLAEEARQSDIPVRILTYSLLDSTADLFADEIEYAPDATRFTVHWWGQPFQVESHLIGDFNVYNILCAIGAALSQGISSQAVQAGVASLAGVLGRMERIDQGQPFLAVVDFAHSPVSLERALRTLRPLAKEGGRLIAIFGSAGLRDQAKRGLMGRVSGELADYTIITAEDPRTENLAAINRAIATGVAEFAPPNAFEIVPDRAEAIWRGVRMARPGDVVAAFGKGHERSMCFGETEYPWSDQDAMGSALKKRRMQRDNAYLPNVC